MHRVFLSYARQDRAKAERILAELREVRVDGWIDASDISSGGAVAEAVRRALMRADAVLVLVSWSSLNNKWVQFEIGAAEALDKPIIPILIEGDMSMIAEAPDILRFRRWLDASHRPAWEVAHEIKKALVR